MPINHLRDGLKRHLSHARLQTLANARVGIAGAGGLGSNVAMLLARSGIEKMRIVDYDVVEDSNLNRQHFWPNQLGLPKVEALAEHLLALNGDMQLELLPVRIDDGNAAQILSDCPLWIEALDQAQAKALFVNHALARGCHVCSASGLCGFGGPPMRKRRMGKLLLVGDFSTGTELAPPLAPRVTQAAAMLADGALEFILADVD